MIAELDLKDPSTFRTSTARPEIAYSVHVLPDDKFDELVLSKVPALVNELPSDSKVIVFGGTISACTVLAEKLNAFLYHAHLETKSEKLQSWRAGAGQVSPIIVATSALGNGINVNNVALVIHVDSLFSMTDFLQESGRAARGGNAARSVSFIRKRQLTQYKRMVDCGEEGFGPDRIGIANYVITSDCRRFPIGATMDGFARSCAQLSGQLCDNCRAPNQVMRHNPSTGTETETETGSISRPSGSGSNRGLGSINPVVSSPPNILNPVHRQGRAQGRISPPVPSLPRGLSDLDGQAYLRSIFHTLSTLCPVCWLLPSSSAVAHKFRQCGHHSVTLGSFLAWSKGIKFPPKTCHYSCGAPLFVCEAFGATECPFKDMLLPMVLMAFRTQPYRDIVLELAQRDLSEAQLLAWVVETKDSKGQSLTLYSKSCYNGVIAFHAIVRHCTSIGP